MPHWRSGHFVRAATGLAAALPFLDRRAFYIAVAAKDAAIARQRLQQGSTGAAVVEVDAGVCRHRFLATRATLRAGDRALQLNHRFSIER